MVFFWLFPDMKLICMTSVIKREKKTILLWKEKQISSKEWHQPNSFQGMESEENGVRIMVI